MKIRERSNLLEGKDPSVREDLLEVLEAALSSIDPYRCVREAISIHENMLLVDDNRIDLDLLDRVIVVGTGKASVGMARAVHDVLGDRITMGFLNVLEKGRIGNIELHRSTHPHPSETAREGAERILSICEGAGQDDLVICLISGGGSAMMPLPPDDVGLEDKKETSGLLMLAGADIQELNTVRKHLSRIKGGNLAKACHPARVLSLIISDVVGDPIESICSGPTAPDPTTFDQALGVLEKYELTEKVPGDVVEHLKRAELETPKPDDRVFEKVSNIIVANNRKALFSGQKKAESLGYNAVILTSSLEGEAREVGKVMASIGNEVVSNHDPVAPPAMLLAGGETTVTVRGKGRGGRNSELVLSALARLLDGVTIASFGTDGIDGNSKAGGAMADSGSLRSDWLDFLENNDSARYFEREGSLMVTGPTGTNVGDIIILAVRKE